MPRPLQVYLDDTDLEQLEKFASEHGWTKSQVVRAAIRALARPRETDALLALGGMIDGLPEDLSQNFERYLGETYVAEGSPGYRRSPRRGRKPLRR